MTPCGGWKRTWLLPIVLSLLLHIPIAILLSRLPPAREYSEPVLKLSLHSVSVTQKTAQLPPQTASPKQEPQPKPQSKPLPDKSALSPGSQKAPAESQSVSAPQRAETGGLSDRQAAGAGFPSDAIPSSDAGAASGTGTTSGASVSSVPAGPVEASSLKILKQVVPDYPAFSRKRGEEGEVRVIVSIRGGTVIEAEIYKSSGALRLDQSALRAAKLWRFAEVAELRVIIPFLFTLTD